MGDSYDEEGLVERHSGRRVKVCHPKPSPWGMAGYITYTKKIERVFLRGGRPYFLRFSLSVVGSIESGLEMDERRRVCCFSSGIGIRGSHSSTNPAVPRWPQVDRLIVEFFLRPVTMRTFSRF